MEVISRKIEELYNDPNNARKHDEKNLRAIKGSLTKFGQQHPIIINDKNIVIAGNGRLEAARQLGWTHIDCVVTDLDTFNASAFSTADNRTAELASWDDMILGSTLQSLREDGFDIGEIGFDTSALDEKYGDVDEPKDNSKEKETKYSLTITLKNEDEQQDLFTELRDRGFKVKA